MQQENIAPAAFRTKNAAAYLGMGLTTLWEKMNPNSPRVAFATPATREPRHEPPPEPRERVVFVHEPYREPPPRKRLAFWGDDDDDIIDIEPNNPSPHRAPLLGKPKTRADDRANKPTTPPENAPTTKGNAAHKFQAA